MSNFESEGCRFESCRARSITVFSMLGTRLCFAPRSAEICALVPKDAPERAPLFAFRISPVAFSNRSVTFTLSVPVAFEIMGAVTLTRWVYVEGVLQNGAASTTRRWRRWRSPFREPARSRSTGRSAPRKSRTTWSSLSVGDSYGGSAWPFRHPQSSVSLRFEAATHMPGCFHTHQVPGIAREST